MRNFVSFIVLFLVTAAAFAHDQGGGIGGGDPGTGTAPEPEVLSLLGIGTLVFLVARRLKK